MAGYEQPHFLTLLFIKNTVCHYNNLPEWFECSKCSLVPWHCFNLWGDWVYCLHTWSLESVCIRSLSLLIFCQLAHCTLMPKYCGYQLLVAGLKRTVQMLLTITHSWLTMPAWRASPREISLLSSPVHEWQWWNHFGNLSLQSEHNQARALWHLRAFFQHLRLPDILHETRGCIHHKESPHHPQLWPWNKVWVDHPYMFLDQSYHWH